MKKSFNCLFAGLLVGVAVSLSSLAYASEKSAYVGVNYTALEQDSYFAPGKKFDTGEVVVRFGGEINKHFSSELRIGTTVKSAEDSVTGAEFKNLYSIGGLLRLRKEIGPITPYVGIGYMWTKEELSGAGPLSGEATLSDVVAAAGLDISLGKKLGLNIEYFALTVEPFNDDNRSGPSAGLFWRF